MQMLCLALITPHMKNITDWPYSSFHHCVKKGLYPGNWVSDNNDLEVGECSADSETRIRRLD